MLPSSGAIATYQDHWLLTSDYEDLGDSGSHAIIIREGAASPTDLASWYASHSGAAARYAATTYTIGTLSNDCSDSE